MMTCKEANWEIRLDEDLEMENVVVVDTSVVMADPGIFYHLGRKWIIVPIAVLGELDGLKKSTDPKKSKAARKASRTLDMLGYRQDIAVGSITEAGSVVRIFSRYTPVDDLSSAADNRIVGAAIRLKEENEHYDILMLTNDRNMRNVARSYGIMSEGYPLRSASRNDRRLLSSNHNALGTRVYCSLLEYSTYRS
jgi:PhoH-like ATPase